MIKHKAFYTHIDVRDKHDADIQNFLDDISKEGHTFISINTIAYGKYSDTLNNLRTEIAYKENQTRKVIIEKTE